MLFFNILFFYSWFLINTNKSKHNGIGEDKNNSNNAVNNEITDEKAEKPNSKYEVDLNSVDFKNLIDINDKRVVDINSEIYTTKISEVTGVEVDEVLEALNRKNSDGSDASYAPLVRGVTKAVADSADELGIYGLIVSRDVKRYYPNGNFLASALGGINSEGTGLTGIELQYDDYLAGIAGMKIGAYDSCCW